MKINRRKFLECSLGAIGGLVASGGALVTVAASNHREQNMIEMYAKDNPFITLWFNGKDVSSRATGCRVHAQPNKRVWGWADFLVLDGDGGAVAGPDRQPLTYRRYGWVRWNR